MPKPPRKKLDPSLVQLLILLTVFFFGFIAAAVLGRQAGLREAHAPRPAVAPSSTSPPP